MKTAILCAVACLAVGATWGNYVCSVADPKPEAIVFQVSPADPNAPDQTIVLPEDAYAGVASLKRLARAAKAIKPYLPGDGRWYDAATSLGELATVPDPRTEAERYRADAQSLRSGAARLDAKAKWCDKRDAAIKEFDAALTEADKQWGKLLDH